MPAGAPTGLALLFHGAGGAPDAAVALLAGQPRAAGLLVLAPASAGRTWDLLLGRSAGDLAQCGALLTRVLRSWPLGRDDLLVGGFSDGASYGLSVGLANGDLFSLLAGFSPGYVHAPARHGHPRVFVSHGTADRVLPVDRCGRAVVRQLRGADYDVTYDEFAGGHVVPAGSVDHALRLWRTPPAAG